MGRDLTAERFNGNISSVVVTTLKQGESPSLVEMAMFGQDPLAWVATYKEGKTFRAPTGTSPESVNFQRLNNDKSGAERSDLATIVWLMGDGTAGDGNNGLGTGSDYHVENEVTHSSASGSSQTRLVFSNSSNYDKIADANISVPARKIFNITNVSPKASLSLSDSDNNIGVSNVVTITALFNKAMTATPTLSISGGLLSNVAFTSYTTEHSQIGDIEGEDSGNGFGSSVTASRNGRIAAASYNHGGSLKGHVRVYDNNGSSWQQVGSDIDGNANEAMGYSVSLSADGKRLAAGGYYAGSITGVVRVYDYNGTNWVQTGSDINGEATGDRSGWDVSLSDDGTRVAVGAPYNDAGNSSSDDRGHVRVYELQSGSWVKLGSDIDGEAAGDNCSGVSLSSDGSRVAIGARKNDGDSGDIDDNRGHVRVYSLLGEVYQYTWDVDSGGAPSDGLYYASVTGTDKAGNSYVAGTQSITFTLDATAPTVILTDTDSDNVVNVSQVVTITAGFSEAMTATPTISITGIVTNVIMTPVSGTNSYTFRWDTSSGTLSDGAYYATVSGTDSIGNAYSVGTQSITFTVDSSTPTVTITTSDSDNTIKPGDNITVTVTFSEAMASGPRITIASAVSNVALTATSSTTWTYSWSTSGVSAGSYTVTVTGSDLAGNTYSGSDKITIRLDSTAPTVTITNSDSDNLLVASDTVTITAIFSEPLTSTPTISISGGLLSNVVMGGGSSGSVSFTAVSYTHLTLPTIYSV